MIKRILVTTLRTGFDIILAGLLLIFGELLLEKGEARCTASKQLIDLG